MLPNAPKTTRRLAVPALVGLLFLVGPVGQGNAAEPPCPSNLSGQIKIVFPKRVAFDRKVTGTYYADGKDGWSPRGTIAVQLFNDLQDEPVLSGEWVNWFFPNEFWLRLGSGSRDWSFVTSAVFSRGAETCVLTQEKMIEAYPGKKLPLRLARGFDVGSVEWRCPLDKSQTDAAPIRLLLTERGRTRRITIDDPCGRQRKTKPRTVKGRYWSTLPDLRFDTLLVDLKPGSPKPIRLRIKAFQRSTRLMNATLRARWVSKPSRRIWWESDAYINYCINKGRPIRSEGGRLYCWTKDRSRYLIRLTP